MVFDHSYFIFCFYIVADALSDFMSQYKTAINSLEVGM